MAISIGREIHDGDVEPPPHLFGCLHPVHRALQADVHQYQIGTGIFRLLQGFFSRRGHNWNVIPQALQA